MSSLFLHKRSSVSSVVPVASALEIGELALNVHDGKIFTKSVSGSVLSFEDSSKVVPAVADYLSTNNVLVSSLTIAQTLSVSGTLETGILSIGTGTTTVLYTGNDAVGINTEFPNQALTVAGNVSATGTYYGDGSNLTGIQAGDTQATTLVRSASANWNSSLPLSGGNLTGAVTTTSTISSTNDIYAKHQKVIIGNSSDTTPVYNIRALTQAEYNAIAIKDNNTLYFIKS